MLFRVMPTGLAYLREIGIKVVNEQMLKLQLPTIKEKIEAGQVSIYGAYISKYWAPPDYILELIEPNMFSWSMSKMHIRAAGEFEAELNNPLLLPQVPIQGHFEALLGHVALQISVRMLKSLFGAPRVESAYCQATVGYVDLNVRNTGVLTDFFINGFKSFIIGNFKPMVEQRMCKMIEQIINNDMNALLSSMPLKVGISEDSIDVLGQTFKTSKSIITPPKVHHSRRAKLLNATSTISLLHIVQNLRKQDLIMDYQLTADPFISYGSIAMASRGEISWHGRGGTPFYPPTIKLPHVQGVHMVEFFATDYVANSMLFHAFRQRLLDIAIGPESTPQLKDLLQTTCGNGYCIGEFLGALGEDFPDRQVEIRFVARRSPLIVFVEGRARFRLHGRMNLYVRPAKAHQITELVIRSDTTMTSNVVLWVNGSKIVGNATIENLDFRLIESKIKDVDQSVFGDLGLFGAEFLEKLLTEILQLGIKIPSMKGVALKSPRLTFHERYLKVATYFKMDEAFAGKIVQGTIRKSLSKLG